MKVRVELGELAVEIEGEKGDITSELVSEIVRPFQQAVEEDTSEVDAVATQRVGFSLDDEEAE